MRGVNDDEIEKFVEYTKEHAVLSHSPLLA
jgi:uncharacterized Fe-S cluster-containing radical SAM superfamily enzyme